MLKQIIAKVRNEKLLTRRETFCLVFIIYLSFGFLLWLAGIFSKGMASEQLGIFYRPFEDFLADFTNVVGYSGKLDPYFCRAYRGWGEKAYPPLVYVIFYLFSRLVNIDQYYEANFFLNMYQDPLLLLIYIIVTARVFVLFYEVLRNKLTMSRVYAVLISFLMLFSRPMLFTLERGNTVIATTLLVSVYLFHYNSANKVKKEIAILSLAVAASLKMTPAVLGILLLMDRKDWKTACRAILYGIVVFILPFFILPGNIIDHGVQMLRNIKQNLLLYTRWEGITFEACLLGIGLPSSLVLSILKYAICGFLVYGSFIIRTPWKKAMMISLVLVTLPNHSGYYCILYMIPSFIMFLNEKEHKAVDWLIFIAALFILQPYQSGFTNILSTSNCILILCGVMIWYIIREIMNKRKSGMAETETVKLA